MMTRIANSERKAPRPSAIQSRPLMVYCIFFHSETWCLIVSWLRWQVNSAKKGEGCSQRPVSLESTPAEGTDIDVHQGGDLRTGGERSVKDNTSVTTDRLTTRFISFVPYLADRTVARSVRSLSLPAVGGCRWSD